MVSPDGKRENFHWWRKGGPGGADAVQTCPGREGHPGDENIGVVLDIASKALKILTTPQLAVTAPKGKLPESVKLGSGTMTVSQGCGGKLYLNGGT